jgi:baculoviral IAP repeat-containing protein 6
LKKISMPPHSFVAFGLFLKIPGYAKCMLKNRKQAQCILKLLLGETGRRNNGEDEFGLSLSIMPFVALKDLLAATKKSPRAENNDLVRFLHENNLLTLLLAILSLLSHHPSRQKSPHFDSPLIPDMSPPGSGSSAHHQAGSSMTSVPSTSNNLNEQFMNGGGGAAATVTAAGSNEDKNNLYWAKGTGFGTGSTMQHWDAEKTLMQQKMEEEHVTCILEVSLKIRKLFFIELEI